MARFPFAFPWVLISPHDNKDASVDKTVSPGTIAAAGARATGVHLRRGGAAHLQSEIV
jgi:hypothetical protein